MTIDPGTLNRRMTIRRRTIVDDPQWGPTEQWIDLRTVWAGIRYDSADEEFAAGQLYAKRIVTFTLRYTGDVSAVDRATCEGVEYDILGITEIGNRDGLEVKAEVLDPGA